MTFEELEARIEAWATARVLNTGDPRNQLLKCVEEIGELVSAELRGDAEAQVDSLGDVLVTLIVYSMVANLPAVGEALEQAWNSIKDRQGQTVNGVFIKNRERSDGQSQ